MGPFWASRKWDGAHKYGYFFAGDDTVMGDIYGCICMHSSCAAYKRDIL